MRTHVVAVALVAAAFAVEAPTASAIPAIHIEVPPIPHALESSRPLGSSDWLLRTPAYEQRLREAGSEESLAFDEAVREEKADEFAEILRKCSFAAMQAELKAREQAEQEGGDPNAVPSLGAELAACLSGQLPETTPEPVKDKVQEWLTEQLSPAAEEAAQNGTPVNATVQLPALTGAVPQTTVDPVPPPSGGGFPWPLVGIGAVVAVGGFALASRRS